jgi:hypothetical protein
LYFSRILDQIQMLHQHHYVQQLRRAGAELLQYCIRLTEPMH